MELALGISLAHALAARASALDSPEDAVNVAGAAPLLVRQHVATALLLAPLHKVDVRQHAVRLELARQLVGDGGVGVQARERDELQHEALLGDIPDEALERLVREAVGHPVERRAEVVH